MRSVYSFNCKTGYGSLFGIFVASDAAVSDIIGKSVYFGEVLGKHSEVSVVLTKLMFVKLTSDVKFVQQFEKFNCETGYNPLDYLEDEEEEEEEEGI